MSADDSPPEIGSERPPTVNELTLMVNSQIPAHITALEAIFDTDSYKACCLAWC